MEGSINFEDPNKKFKDYWEKKTNDGVKQIRTVGISNNLQAQLELLIDKLFIDSYVLEDKKDIKILQIFLESVLNSMEKDTEGDELKKFRLFEMLKDDLADLLGVEKQQREN